MLAVDLPGHGDSFALPERPTVRAVAAAVEAALDALDVGRVHVLGSARVAREFARRDRTLSVRASCSWCRRCSAPVTRPGPTAPTATRDE